jgi:hypothetical protein
MIVADVITRLKAMSPQPFRIIAGALELAAVREQPAATPAAYVFIEAEAAADNRAMTGAVEQRVETDLAVVIVASNVADAAGGALAGDIETLKARVRNALVGFLPASGSDIITYASAEIVRMRGGFAACQLTFSAPYDLDIR